MNYDPNTGAPYGGPPPGPPYGGPVYLQPHRGATILVLGILGLLCTCLPLGIVAWIMGNSDLAAMREGRMDRSGEGITRAGQILGIITCALTGLIVLFYGAIIMLGIGGAMLSGPGSPP
jgi:hypothetical protein